ncbi:purine-cytosine permease family protein [Nocardia sp. NPDC003345]
MSTETTTAAVAAPPAGPPVTAPAPQFFADRMGRIERCGIEYIPEENRKSTPRNLTAILFGSSLALSVIIIGAFPVTFGLSFGQAATSVVAGTLLGAILLAPMGLMGPRTGTNNPVASGAFFGVAGRLIGSLLEATAALAFAALSIWTGGDALAGALVTVFHLDDTTVPRLIAYAVLAVIVTAISVLGHANLVAAQRFMIPTAGLCLLLGLFAYGGDFDPSYAGTGEYAFGSATATWMASFLITTSTISSLGPYAGDWTRHIAPRLHSDRAITLALFVGALCMGIPMLWGTFTATAVLGGGAVTAEDPYVLGLVAGAPAWFVPAVLYLGLASGTAQAVINTYGTGLDTSSIVPRLNRVQATLVACGVSAALVYIGHFYSAIVAGISVFLQVLTCFSLPWIVIVAIGHFYRRGYYDVAALQVFNQGRRGGIYWFTAGFNLRGLLVWMVAAAVGLLCSSNAWFIGPGAQLFGGIDLGFLIAGVLAAVLYPLALIRYPESAEVFGAPR